MKQVTCPICGQTVQAQGINGHMKVKHEGVTQMSLICDLIVNVENLARLLLFQKGSRGQDIDKALNAIGFKSVPKV
ncbi:MAG: hypothetical protein ABSB38_00100 [Dehalococcoidia bacterium]|jgi:hypothetical protein